jgi:hypothetical protein
VRKASTKTRIKDGYQACYFYEKSIAENAVRFDNPMYEGCSKIIETLCLFCFLIDGFG